MRRRSALAVLLVAALGCLGTLLSTLALHRGEEHLTERTADQQAAVVARAVVDGMRRYSDYVTGLAAAVGAQQVMESTEFDAITAPIEHAVLPGVAGLAYVVPADDDEVRGVQDYWRARGVTGLTLRPAAAATDHRFIVLGRSADGIPAPIGFDLAQVEAPAEAMRIAQETTEVTTSGAYRLVKDAQRPVEEQQAGFVLAVMVRGTPPAADAGKLRGWLLLGIRSGDFLRDGIGAVAGQGVAVELSDSTTAGPVPVVRWQPEAPADPDTAARTMTVEVPGRVWQLTVQPTTKLVAADGVSESRLALLVGTVITFLVTALTTTIVTSRDRAVRRVHHATTALREDIHRREAVERQLRDREAELTRFAGVIAHDLRSPLARITGYTDFLREEAADQLGPEHREFLQRLSTGTHQMSTLLDDLLGYATADNRPLRTTAVDLATLVAEIARDQADAGRERPPVIMAAALPVVGGDPTLLRQVFENLIGNAVKYMAPGAIPRVEISSRRDGVRWRIEVCDNGIGIPADQCEAVFTAFARVDGSENYPGTGLGLAIVHRIVERHGGVIGCEPGAEGGTRFWLTLGDPPAAAGEEEVRPALARGSA